MSEHTKGDWVVLDARPEGEECLAIAVVRDERPIIARIKSTISPQQITDEDMANANLIAAAPELLEALEVVMESFDDISDENLLFDWQRDARRAITKAKGES